jgi:hypothetical protein
MSHPTYCSDGACTQGEHATSIPIGSVGGLCLSACVGGWVHCTGRDPAWPWNIYARLRITSGEATELRTLVIAELHFVSVPTVRQMRRAPIDWIERRANDPEMKSQILAAIERAGGVSHPHSCPA